jgi:cytidylate kinase
MAIITVSRQLYSFGDEIAKKVADDLGYDLIDKEKIGEALAMLGLPATELERFDEKKPSIWASLASQHNRFSYLMKAAIYDFAQNNETLILGRGAQILLKDLPGTLHVRVVAPLKVRLGRIMEHEGYDEKNGERVLRQGDRDSSGYIRSFFNADWNDPDYYDLLINTKTISIDTAAGMMMNAVRSAEFKSDPDERSDKLAALSLQQKAEAVIMEVQRGNNIYVAVTDVDRGIVTLRGTTNSTMVKDDCGLAISKITGVREIKNEIAVIKAV